MRIEILEQEIKQLPYGAMLKGEVRVVDEQFGRFACANGWARHLPADGETLVPTGTRGSQDYHDPVVWKEGDAAQKPLVQPADIQLSH